MKRFQILFFIAAAIGGTQAMAQGLPNQASPLMVGSGNCAACHSGLRDSNGADVSVDTHWRATMMANSARDPFFLAKVSAEVEAFPAIADVIEDKCANCHMGMAHEQALADGQPTTLLGDGFTDPAHPLHALAMDGVSCALCHQIQPDGLGEPASFSGGYVIDTEITKPDRPIFGPYSDPRINPMQMASLFTPALGEHLSESALCASCHVLFTPTVDAEGAIVGEFPEQLIFFEWLASDYADPAAENRSCQDCHMPVADGGVKISVVPPFLDERSPFNQHHFVGGNRIMLEIMRDNREALNATSSEAQFDAAISRTNDQLTLRSVNLGMDVSSSPGRLEAEIAIENRAGHKFPAGFPSRRAWIHLIATDASGETVFESGRPLPNGSIEGVDSDENEDAYEAHVDLIENAGQVAVYEGVMNDSDGAVTTTLLRGAAYLKDNRLLPKGFNPEGMSEQAAPAGLALDDDDFAGGSDEVTYLIDVSGRQGPFAIEARLLYQPVSYPFIRSMQASQTPEAIEFLGYWAGVSQSYVVCSSIQAEGIDVETGVPEWKTHK